MDTHASVTLTSREGFHEVLPDVIQVAARLRSGDSGGPAIDAAGKVVGVIEGGGDGVVDLTPASELRGAW